MNASSYACHAKGIDCTTHFLSVDNLARAIPAYIRHLEREQHRRISWAGVVLLQGFGRNYDMGTTALHVSEKVPFEPLITRVIHPQCASLKGRASDREPEISTQFSRCGLSCELRWQPRR